MGSSMLRSLPEATFLVLVCHERPNLFDTGCKGGSNMLSNLTTRRGFAAKLAAFLPSLGLARLSPPAEQAQGGVQKLDGNGKPSDGKGFITPLIIHNGLIYIAGQGAHSRGDKSDEGKTPTIEMHTKMVMEGVKNL